MAEIVNLAWKRRGLPRGCVKVDRSTPWGNPFVIGKDGDRAEVVAKYRRWLWEQVRTGRLKMSDLAALARKPLACWCAPLPCHAQVLAVAAEWAAAREERILEEANTRN